MIIYIRIYFNSENIYIKYLIYAIFFLKAVFQKRKFRLFLIETYQQSGIYYN